MHCKLVSEGRDYLWMRNHVLAALQGLKDAETGPPTDADDQGGAGGKKNLIYSLQAL